MQSASLASIILAAGQGTRMKSDRAKVLHEIAGEPMVNLPIELSLALEARPVVLVIGHQADTVREAVEARFGDRVGFEVQAEQRGTGHAVMHGMRSLEGFSGQVVILYGDVPLLRAATIERLRAALRDNPGAPIAAITTHLSRPTGYGRVLRDAGGRVTGVIEEKDATPEQRKITEINAGIYLADAAFLRRALSRLSNDNAQREYYLTDVIGIAANEGGAVPVVVEDSSEVLGVNNRAELSRAGNELRARINEELMLAGVSILDPASTFISKRAQIGRDTVIHPGVQIRGDTRIGERCVIDAGAVITSSEIDAGVEIKPYSVLEEARVHTGAIIGPFARLRPGAVVMEAAHVGNFVELKKTVLGKGAKANHLAYLGDAEVGEGANVGAGTITCNYDGYGKYVTKIGSRVFVGSNSTLVAPLEIGDDSYLAAGSTITEPVEANSLVFGRARQTNKPGRAETLRAEARAKAEAAKRGKSK